MENKKLNIYEYYFKILELMLNDMSDVTLEDVQDVLDEINEELGKIN